jgi:hypothetical protein
MTGPADVWAAAFAKPSKLWQPAPNWKPYEWTPLVVALGRIEDSLAGDIEMAEIDLHQAFVAGRMKSALRYLSSDDGSKQIWLLLLQPKFWQHLKIISMSRTELLVEGDVEGQPLTVGLGFFVCTADLDKHLLGESAARPPDVVQPHADGRKRSVRLAKELIEATFPQSEWRRMGVTAVRKCCEQEAETREVQLPSPDSFSRAMGRRK